jgi:hypothetical protein
MLYLNPIEIFNVWAKMEKHDYVIYEFFGLVKGFTEPDGWNHFILFVISMLKIM